MKTTKTNLFLYFIFLATVIPTIIVYAEETYKETNAYQKSVDAGKNIKATKQFGEALLFGSITTGYIILAILIVLFPKYWIPYLVLIIGTIIIIVLYYLRIYGIPIPGTEIVIVDLSTDWRDVVTKIAQQIMVVPVTALLILRRTT